MPKKLEIIGLSILLIAVGLQVFVEDQLILGFLDGELWGIKEQNYIIFGAITTGYEDNYDAYVKDRDMFFNAYKTGERFLNQAKIASNIRLGFYTLGSLLLIISKVLESKDA